MYVFYILLDVGVGRLCILIVNCWLKVVVFYYKVYGVMYGNRIYLFISK